MLSGKRILCALLIILLLISTSSCGSRKGNEENARQESSENTPEKSGEVPEAPPVEDHEETPEENQDKEQNADPQDDKRENEDEQTRQDDQQGTEKPEDENSESFDISDVQPVINGDHYQYNPYLVSKEAQQCFDTDFFKFYKDFLTAYMNYETSCTCPDVEYVKQLDMLISYECPFYAGDDLCYSWATDYDYDAQRLNWTYQVDKDSLQVRIQSVASAMQDFLDLVKTSDGEERKVQTLYHAFCPLMTYDYDSKVSRERIDGCYALLEHRGICVTFSDAFAQILAQADIDATIANGATVDGESHVWNYICVNGQYYFFDTTFELNYQNGNAYIYYGMNMSDRVSGGVPEDSIWLGRYREYELAVAEKHLSVY